MNNLSEVEKTMVDILESGNEPTLDDFDLDEMLKHSEAIGRSSLLPEFVLLVIKSRTHTENDVLKYWTFIEESLPFCKKASALMEIVDLVDLAPDENVAALFQIFINTFTDVTNTPACQSAALDGALRYVIRKPSLRFELVSNLLKITEEDDRDLIRSAARVIGVVHANWPETELFDKLVELAENVDVIDQVAFEIGACKIQFALNSRDVKTIERELDDSKYWFERSLNANTNRHDSAIYLECVKCILDFHRGLLLDAEEISAKIKKHATFLRAWNRSNANPPWLLNETIQLLYWDTLACKLSRLSSELLKPSWYEAAVVVETLLIAIWTASKSLLMRDSESGLEAFVRPRIQGTIGATAGQAHALKEWLRRNEENNDFETLNELALQIDSVVRESSSSGNSNIETLNLNFEEIINESSIVDKSFAYQAISNSLLLSMRNVTVQEQTIIEHCIEFVKDHPDYQKELYHVLFDSILVWTIRFLSTRLEMTKKDEPVLDYLFRQNDGKKPKEDKIQVDYKNVMVSTIGGTEVEVMNVAGGRADVLFRLNTERIITEVKREERDSSFDSLFEEYSPQAADYQNVSGRLGFVLVLDQTTPDTGTPHISTLVKPIQLTRQGESTPRMLVFVKVPGERLRPSDLTKAAKSKGAKDRRERKQNS